MVLRIVIALSCRPYIPVKAAGLSTVLYTCSCFCVRSVKHLFADVETSFGVFSDMHTVTFLTLSPQLLVISQRTASSGESRRQHGCCTFLHVESEVGAQRKALYRALLSSHSVCLDTHTWL